MKKEKILIIKTGYSEFLEGHNDSRTVSFGDVLRTTSLLHLYKDANVTWVTDRKAFPLLERNSYINRLLPYDFIISEQLKAEKFDTLINLEKVPGICALANRINAWRKYGFRFDPEKGRAKAYDKAFEVLGVSVNSKLKKENPKTFNELLFEMVGKKWEGEESILGYQPKSKEVYDVCLNTTVGEKWPTKTWPLEYWDKLEKDLIEEGFIVTRQDKQPPEKKILTDLESYMDWINSSKIIISCDTLGLHLAIALRKKVLGLFGPTSSKEIYFYERGEAILPNPALKCMPCFEPKCLKCEMSSGQGGICMNNISPRIIYEKVKHLCMKGT